MCFPRTPSRIDRRVPFKEFNINVRRNFSVRHASFGAEPMRYSPRPPTFSNPCRGCFWFGCANGVARSACVWVNNSASVTARPYMRCLLAFVLYWAVTAHCEPSRFRSRRDPRRRSSCWTHAMFRAGVSGGVAEHARAIEAILRRSWTVRYLCETACTYSHAVDTP